VIVREVRRPWRAISGMLLSIRFASILSSGEPVAVSHSIGSEIGKLEHNQLELGPCERPQLTSNSRSRHTISDTSIYL
jgi:hypothetical protein